MKIGYRNTGLSAALALGVVMSVAPRAHAEITLYDKDHWTLKTDGMAQGFYSLTMGDSEPSTGSAPVFDVHMGGWDHPAAGSDGSFFSSRFRSGWAGGRFNWAATNQVTDDTKISAVLGIAYAISTDNGPTHTNNNWDIRNAHIKIESTWGELLIGRNVGLYTLGAIISTAQTTSANLGLGNACSTAGDGLGCYTSGYGAKFPGFWAGVFYTSPDLSGLKIKVAALDPETAGEDLAVGPMGGAQVQVSQPYTRRPLPMFQTLIRYEGAAGSVKIIPHFDGFWQEVGRAATPGAPPPAGTSDTLNPMGAGAGLDVVAGGLHVAASGTLEHGTSFYGPMYTGASVIDGNYKLRNGSSLLAMAMYSFGEDVDVNAGYGQTNISRTSFDEANNLNINKSQSNIFAAVQYHWHKNFTMMAELNVLNHKWQEGNTQNVQVFNLGAAFTY